MKLIAEVKKLENRYDTNYYYYTNGEREKCRCGRLSGIRVDGKIGSKIINTNGYCNLTCFYFNIGNNGYIEKEGAIEQ